MTLNDIKKEVAALGFESESAIDTSIEFAARRALATIYNEHGVLATGRIYQNSPMPRMHLPMVIHTPDKDDVISLTDCTYAFVISGVGAFEISDKDGARVEDFDTRESYVYGRVKGTAEIRFMGEFRYTVYDLCTYDEAFAEGEAPPRYAKMREYSLKELLPDFLFASAAPIDREGKRIDGATVSCGRLKVPYGYVGEILLEYRKSAPEVSVNTPEKDLMIPTELEELVPLLSAAYVWLDDDADKAQYYMSLYRDGMSAVKLYTRREVECEFTDTTRWA